MVTPSVHEYLQYTYIRCTVSVAPLPLVCSHTGLSLHKIYCIMLSAMLQTCLNSISIDSVVTHRVRWDDPFGGMCKDTFCMTEDGQRLTQVTEMVMKTGRLCNYK